LSDEHFLVHAQEHRAEKGPQDMPVETKPSLQTVGSYDLVGKIADGGMGTVYRARQRLTGQVVAIKIVSAHLTRNTVLMKRFEKEYHAAKALDHPNIVKALDYGTHDGSPYLVMEFVEGESLGQKIERQGRMPEAEAIPLIAQVAQALHKAHKQGLVHRDVKPDNVLVTPEGTAKLTDLGLVKELDANLNLTRTNRGLGTPHFMAPEQFRNAKNADARCDIYSLAATLYMMVTGELPFKGCNPLDAWMRKINNDLTPPRNLVPTLSERMDWAIRRSMSADPALRAATCREFVEDVTGHSTRKLAPIPDADANPDLWYLVYRDEEEVVHTVKGTKSAIRKSLKEELLGDASNVRASRSKSGPFEPLRTHPEFRDLVIEPAPLSAASGSGMLTPPLTSNSTVNSAPRETIPSTLIVPEGGASAASVASPLPRSMASGPRINRPMIDLGGSRDGTDWLNWVLLFLVAALTGALGYFMLPWLSTLRLP
jgi:serine/threonine protein kinase